MLWYDLLINDISLCLTCIFVKGTVIEFHFFLLQAAKGLVPDKVVSRTMCKREYHCLLKGEIEHSSPPSLPLPHLIMCLDDAKSN